VGADAESASAAGGGGGGGSGGGGSCTYFHAFEAGLDGVDLSQGSCFTQGNLCLQPFYRVDALSSNVESNVCTGLCCCLGFRV